MKNNIFYRSESSRYYPYLIGVIATLFLFLCLSTYFYLFTIVSDVPRSLIWDILINRRIMNLVVRSLSLAGIVALVASALGALFAILIERTDLWMKKTWHALIVISMAIPSYVLAYAWVTIFPDMASFKGAIMILSLITIPYSYLNIRSALKNLDTSIEEVARSLGSSNLKTLGVVVLPQLRRSILSGMLIGVLYVITDFGAVSTLRVEVFTWVIYGSYRSGFSPERAAVLASLLFIIASAIVLAESIAGKKQKRTNAARVSHASKMLKLGKWNLLFQAVLALYFGSLVGVPLVRSMGWVFQYKSAVDPGDLIDPFTNTLFLGTAVVALGFVFAFSIALFSTYSKIGLFIEKLVTAFHGIPGIVTAIAMVYVGTRIVPAIYLEWPLVIVALC
ncbi:MAG TPA: ABC transporter permease subunit, partial [Acidimicrobiia bacterium]|nr:ABC transporter permease subunit [Acidimicrobiia bacterium]